MSECVVRMEMPENCCECQLRQEDYEMGEEFCPFTGVECLSIGRQNNCPIICSLPEGHGRLVDADVILQYLRGKTAMFEAVDGKMELVSLTIRNDLQGFIKTILETPTIVQAERSET